MIFPKHALYLGASARDRINGSGQAITLEMRNTHLGDAGATIDH